MGMDSSSRFRNSKEPWKEEMEFGNGSRFGNQNRFNEDQNSRGRGNNAPTSFTIGGPTRDGSSTFDDELSNPFANRNPSNSFQRNQMGQNSFQKTTSGPNSFTGNNLASNFGMSSSVGQNTGNFGNQMMGRGGGMMGMGGRGGGGGQNM